MYAHDAFTIFLWILLNSLHLVVILQVPLPLSKNEVALSISFALQKGNHNIIGDVWRSVVQIK